VEAPLQQAACWSCGTATGGAAACPGCGAPQALGGDADLFAVLGLPRRLVVDRDDLERRWHDASRAVHPDRHQTGAARARELSVAASSVLNRAVRTLRDPIARGRYWLELHGTPLGESNNRVPPSLAALVFETQEQLEALRDAPGDASLRRAVRAERAALDERVRGLERELLARYVAWDAGDASAAAVLDELKRRLSEIAYLRTLERDVDAALER
jgi:molecular chaperone HscB